MTQRQRVEITYRGKVHSGEWCLRGGRLHLVSSLGTASAPTVNIGFPNSSPSGIAEGLLWDLARRADPKRPFFFWR